eukprot:scaffold261577_cov38-Prasinocladus_malaysianus.AAC.1
MRQLVNSEGAVLRHSGCTAHPPALGQLLELVAAAVNATVIGFEAVKSCSSKFECREDHMGTHAAHPAPRANSQAVIAKQSSDLWNARVWWHLVYFEGVAIVEAVRQQQALFRWRARWRWRCSGVRNLSDNGHGEPCRPG